MKDRIYIKDLKDHIDKEVIIAGWVDVRRDQGKMIFFDFRDMSGKAQGVVLPNAQEALEVGSNIRPEWVVEARGKINKRPENAVQSGKLNGDIEIEILDIKVLGKAKELPFEKKTDVNFDTYLDHLPLTLRTDKGRAIFKVQSKIIQAFREFFTTEGFMEFQAPKIIGEDAEGGSSVFDIDYLGKTAHLAQSPQFYKQIMVGVYERVFTTGNVYRAEKHSTARHLNEYTSLDAEIGFIDDHKDIMSTIESLMKFITKTVNKECKEELAIFDVEEVKISESIPYMKLREAQRVIKDEYGEDCSNEPDLSPQHERWLSEYALKKYGSDFIFITHYPVEKRPMYTYEDKDDPGFTKSFDLLFRGLEASTGGQRINDYDTLIEKMKSRNMNPEQFSFYLQAFKYGMPPHGGFGMGLERLTAKFLGLDNIKEATLFPREINRIDNLLSR